VSSKVLVFSADELRGKILEKVLNRQGFECLNFNRILGTRDEIAPHSPDAVIIDTERCFSEEINHLKNICQKLKHTTVIVLGKETVIDRFKGPRFRRGFCMYDPIDPELIAEKIEEIVSGKKKKWKLAEGDMFENTLKHLLRLD
jgi:DNA-binding NtrC family response regulator